MAAIGESLAVADVLPADLTAVRFAALIRTRPWWPRGAAHGIIGLEVKTLQASVPPVPPCRGGG